MKYVITHIFIVSGSNSTYNRSKTLFGWSIMMKHGYGIEGSNDIPVCNWVALYELPSLPCMKYMSFN